MIQQTTRIQICETVRDLEFENLSEGEELESQVKVKGVEIPKLDFKEMLESHYLKFNRPGALPYEIDQPEKDPNFVNLSK